MPKEPSDEQQRIQKTIEENAPFESLVLEGWAMVAEWSQPNGDKVLTRMASPDVAVWEMKGFFHEGMHGNWLEDVAAGGDLETAPS